LQKILASATILVKLYLTTLFLFDNIFVVQYMQEEKNDATELNRGMG